MNSKEFSSEFDILYNNIMSNKAPSIDEYEKSVFLTKAQDELIKNYFNRSNKYRAGATDNEKRNADFDHLIRIAELEKGINFSGKLYDKSILLESLNEPYLMVLNETCYVSKEIKTKVYNEEDDEYIEEKKTIEVPLTVIPVNFHILGRFLSRNFKYPPKGQCWKYESINSDQELVLPPGCQFKSFRCRYVAKPDPIILCDLTAFPEDENGLPLSIEGISYESLCKLNPSIHPEILQRAVELAAISYTQEKAQLIMTSGQRSE